WAWPTRAPPRPPAAAPINAPAAASRRPNALPTMAPVSAPKPVPTTAPPTALLLSVVWQPVLERQLRTSIPQTGRSRFRSRMAQIFLVPAWYRRSLLPRTLSSALHARRRFLLGRSGMNRQHTATRQTNRPKFSFRHAEKLHLSRFGR